MTADATLPEGVEEFTGPLKTYTVFPGLFDWCVKAGKYYDPTETILYKGEREDARSYARLRVAMDSGLRSRWPEEMELLRSWFSDYEYLVQTEEGLAHKRGYTRADEAPSLEQLRQAELPLQEILVELRSMVKAREAQPRLPMELEP